MTFRSLVQLDARLSDRLRVAERPGPIRSLAILFAHSGDSWLWWPALLALWFAGNADWKRWAAVQFVSIVVLAVVVLVIKFRVRRLRPAGEWGEIYRSTDPHSFPSGHAARAFLLAVLASGLGPAWLALALWVWAPLVALARVAMGVHYVSDILAGILLGIVCGLIGLEIYPALFGWLSGWLGFAFW